MGNKATFSPRQVREWSDYLRGVANRLSKSPEDAHIRMAQHFYNVHYAIGPEDMTESIFALDEEFLKIVANEESKTLGRVMCELVESIEIIIREGDSLGPKFINQSVWNSVGLRDYLCGLEIYLKLKLPCAHFAETPVKPNGLKGHPEGYLAKKIQWLSALLATILFFLAGVFSSGKYEPKILLVPGCLLVAILLTFFSLRKEKK